MTDARFIEVSGAGDPVILLHSSGLSGRQFRRLASMLGEQGFQTIVPDLGGHGRSPLIEEMAPFSFLDDVAWVTELLAERGPAHLVGHSLGAFVGLKAARAQPDMIRSLVLFEPVAFGVLDPTRDQAALSELTRLDFSRDDREHWLRTFVDYWGGVGAWSALREDAREEFRRVGWAVREGVRTLLDDHTPAADYRVVRAPVTLLSGERSPLAARAVVRALGATLENARVVMVPEAGHMAPLTQADEVNGLVVAALVRARENARH